ncbi:hypothetical protein jhhlp_005631, partial [Lomentospora prolificans]
FNSFRPHLAIMYANATRAVARPFARRAFSTTRGQFSSPYHYPEGPRSNFPFNTKSKFFPIGYWTFMAVGFGTPFAISVWQTYKPKA